MGVINCAIHEASSIYSTVLYMQKQNKEGG